MWTEQEINNLIRKLVANTGLGSNGEIVKLLASIDKKLGASRGNAVPSPAQRNNQRQSASPIPDSLVGGLGAKANNSSIRDPFADRQRSQSQQNSNQQIDTTNSIQETGRGLRILSQMFSPVNNGLNILGVSTMLAAKSTNSFSGVMSAIVGSGLLLSFSNLLGDNTESLRETYEVGRQFGGSLLNFNKAVADAALPMGEFTELIVKNSSNMAALGGPSGLIGLQKAVRTNMLSFGAYGLQVDDINQLLGDYIDTLTIYGPMDERAKKQAATSFQELISETSALSTLTGRSRKEMLKQINDASRSANFQSSLFGLSASAAQDVRKSLDTVNGVFTAFGQESGAFLSQMVGDAASGFSGALSEMGTTLINSGVGNLVSDFDRVGEKIRNHTATQDDAVGVVSEFMKTVESNMVNLRAQQRIGNTDATKVLQIYAELSKQLGDSSGIAKWQAAMKEAAKKQEDANKSMEPFTKFMMNFSNLANMVTGAFSGAFWNSISPKLGKFAEALTPSTSTIDGFVNLMTMAGAALGAVVGTLIDIGNMLTKVTAPIHKFSDWAAKLINSFTGANDNKLSDTIFAGIMTIGAGVLLYFKTKILSTMFSLLSGMAANVLKGQAGTKVSETMADAFSGSANGVNDPFADTDSRSGGNAGRKGGWIKKLGRGVGGALKSGGLALIGGLSASIVDAVMDDGTTGKETIKEVLTWSSTFAGIGLMIGGPWGAAIGAALGVVTGVVSANFDEIATGITSLWDNLGKSFDSFAKWISDGNMWSGLLDTVTSFTVDPIATMFETVKNGVTGMFDGIVSIFSDMLSWFTSLDISGAIKSSLMEIPMPDSIRQQLLTSYDRGNAQSGSPSISMPMPPPPPKPSGVAVPDNMTVAQNTNNTPPQTFQDQAMIDQNALLLEMARVLGDVNKNIVTLRDFV